MYGPDGAIVEMITTREPEWDEIDRAMVDAYLNWRADLHSCGRPMSESLKDSDKPNQAAELDYIVSTETCLACLALDKEHAKKAEADKSLRDAGLNPDMARVTTVLPFAEISAEGQAQVIADRAEAARRRNPPRPS